MPAMRVGYGYSRHEDDFKGADVERVWIDHKGTERLERADMLREGGLRSGDTLVLLSAGDLGRGGELPGLRRWLQ